MSENNELEFDFSRLKSSNSAGLALMIEWIKLAKRSNKKIRFLSISEDLKAIANINESLTKFGIAVLRFDMTAIGESEGEFTETNENGNLLYFLDY